MKKLLVIALALAVASCAASTPRKLEKDYQRPWCEAHMGRLEVVLDDKARVDCLTPTHAVEFDFAKKWAEAVGQALYYAEKTGHRAGIVLIVGPKDGRYVNRLRWLIDSSNLPVDVWTVAK